MPRVIKEKFPPSHFIRLKETAWYQPVLWEVFRFSLNTWEYMYGRVIHMSPKFDFSEPRKDYLLVYIYNVISYNDEIDINILQKEKLLLALTAWREIWQWGYFETIWYPDLEKKDYYSPICFDYIFLERDNYRDEEGRILDKDYYPIILCGFTNIQWVESTILKAIENNM